MSKNGNLTREQAMAIVGAKAVEKVERENCEPTNRVGYNGSCQNDDLTEWSASVSCQDQDGNDVTLVAYYYTDDADEKLVEEVGGDWGAIDWEINGYEII